PPGRAPGGRRLPEALRPPPRPPARPAFPRRGAGGDAVAPGEARPVHALRPRARLRRDPHGNGLPAARAAAGLRGVLARLLAADLSRSARCDLARPAAVLRPLLRHDKRHDEIHPGLETDARLQPAGGADGPGVVPGGAPRRAAVHRPAVLP